MIKLQIILGDNLWKILIYYNVNKNNIKEIEDVMKYLNATKYEIIDSIHTILYEFNTGMTYTDFKRHTTIICISKYTSNEQFINTIVHESKHAQSHILPVLQYK